MKISIKWLNDYLDVSGLNAQMIANLLTFSGVEVESIHGAAKLSEDIVVGKIISFGKHPNADRLRVCQVEVGESNPRQIVCGASNFKSGDLVPVALPGAKLEGNFVIKEAKLRGVDSFGMMCSANELGLGEDKSGLMILDNYLVVGAPLSQILDSEAIMDLEITPNRADLLSHLGIARELASLTSKEFINQKHYAKIESKLLEANSEQILIQENTFCLFYSARIIKGIKVAPSPQWLQKKLTSLGLKPINNVVDIANYVLHDMGQPLHAFDFDKISGGITIRNAKEGEKINALDDKIYSLKKKDVVIADEQSILALGGIIGGNESSVNQQTKNILLESAYFIPKAVRKTARRLVISTDSSYRFERGVDAEQVLGASEFATRLICEICGGNADEAILTAGQKPSKPKPVAFDYQRAIKLVGFEFSNGEIDNILNKFNIVKKNIKNSQKLDKQNSDISYWKIPSYRRDLCRHIDLVEEIVRYYGVEKIPAKQSAEFGETSQTDVIYDYTMRLKKNLAARGLYEIQSLKMMSSKEINLCIFNKNEIQQTYIKIKKPLNDEQNILCPSLIPGLLKTAINNSNNGAKRFSFFEIANIYKQFSKKYVEKKMLSILIGGKKYISNWHIKKNNDFEIFDLIGIIETIFKGLKILIKEEKPDNNLTKKATIFAEKQKVGSIGQISPQLARKLEIEAPIFIAELEINKIYQITKKNRENFQFKEIIKFPPVTRDVSLEIPLNIKHSQIETFFDEQQKQQKLLKKVKLFDVFTDPTGKKIPKDKKALAYSLTYLDEKQTLRSKKIDEIHKKICSALKKALPIEFR